MHPIYYNIRNRLSLRPPQAESLEILANLAEQMELFKEVDLVAELEKVQSKFPTCVDFERQFPSLCFSLATGVGKTRLMGAFIAYLHLKKGIRNFFVLAPNLTIYNKLIEDFGNSNHSKYVFQGIAEFVSNPPQIITGDNYQKANIGRVTNDCVNINVFNISKINSETRGGKDLKIKRLSEYLGQSYFEYLTKLDDLVVLMDESHHYRADRGMAVINELKPILGLELTATPQSEKGGKTIKFKNVVYEYSLANAMADGFVKEPSVATRKDFDPTAFSSEELDRIKLEDGVSIHEKTKLELDIYARDNRINKVKPFVLVVAKDTKHSAQIQEFITSKSFFNGCYADRVMEIHSNQKGDEKDENIEQLLSLEHPQNPIEIVIHVNMLKEGWDVTNLYTIIPLRTSASSTLTEQTIGRGLRLPYGKRTGVDAVDRLTIVSHDRFQAIIDEANKPDSLIRRDRIITIDPEERHEVKEIITIRSSFAQNLDAQRAEAQKIEDIKERKQKEQGIEQKSVVYELIQNAGNLVKTKEELRSKKVQEKIIEQAIEREKAKPQQNLFQEDQEALLREQIGEIAEEVIQSIIEIPRITVVPKDLETGFDTFDLDVSNLNLRPVSEEILIKSLENNEKNEYLQGGGRVKHQRLPHLVVNEVINEPWIDYDEHADLLFQLADQAILKLTSYLNEDEIQNVVWSQKRALARFIIKQLEEHFYQRASGYEVREARSFVEILDHNYSCTVNQELLHYSETVEPTRSIPFKLFTGFKRAYHLSYKFDSKTEKDFASILETDTSSGILRWLRPAPNQFHIFWDHNSKRYEPDFVVETEDGFYLVETKKAADIATSHVEQKTQAAKKYCEQASKIASKPWRYIIISHDAVRPNMSFEGIIQEFGR